MIRPDFVFRPDPLPDRCSICPEPTLSWSLESYVGETPVETICAECAIAIAKLVIATPAAHDMIDLDERRSLAMALKVSHTQTAVKQFKKQTEDDDATAKRLLS